MLEEFICLSSHGSHYFFTTFGDFYLFSKYTFKRLKRIYFTDNNKKGCMVQNLDT